MHALRPLRQLANDETSCWFYVDTFTWMWNARSAHAVRPLAWRSSKANAAKLTLGRAFRLREFREILLIWHAHRVRMRALTNRFFELHSSNWVWLSFVAVCWVSECGPAGEVSGQLSNAFVPLSEHVFSANTARGTFVHWAMLSGFWSAFGLDLKWGVPRTFTFLSWLPPALGRQHCGIPSPKRHIMAEIWAAALNYSPFFFPDI